LTRLQAAIRLARSFVPEASVLGSTPAIVI
jgi:hypothetical protein